MGAIVIFHCDKCDFKAYTLIVGRHEGMMKGDNHKSAYYCAHCQKNVQLFLDEGFKCPICGRQELVGEHVFVCPKCKKGKIVEDENGGVSI